MFPRTQLFEQHLRNNDSFPSSTQIKKSKIHFYIFIFTESLLDRLINVAWPPGFFLLRPVINDLVSTAFTEIFNRNFQDFDFNQLLAY